MYFLSDHSHLVFVFDFFFSWKCSFLAKKVRMFQLREGAQLSMLALEFHWENPRYVIQPSQHQAQHMPEGLGSSQISYKEQKFSFQLRKKISYYYFHLENHWVGAMLVLVRKRSKFTQREMLVLFPHSMPQTPSFILQRKRIALLEMNIFLCFPPLECSSIPPHVRLFLPTLLPPTTSYRPHIPYMWSTSFFCTQENLTSKWTYLIQQILYKHILYKVFNIEVIT